MPYLTTFLWHYGCVNWVSVKLCLMLPEILCSFSSNIQKRLVNPELAGRLLFAVYCSSPVPSHRPFIFSPFYHVFLDLLVLDMLYNYFNRFCYSLVVDFIDGVFERPSGCVGFVRRFLRLLHDTEDPLQFIVKSVEVRHFKVLPSLFDGGHALTVYITRVDTRVHSK